MDFMILFGRFLMCTATFCLVVALTKLTLLLIRLVKEDLIRSVESEDYDFEGDNNN